jgi:hypothetical protein
MSPWLFENSAYEVKINFELIPENRYKWHTLYRWWTFPCCYVYVVRIPPVVQQAETICLNGLAGENLNHKIDLLTVLYPTEKVKYDLFQGKT